MNKTKTFLPIVVFVTIFIFILLIRQYIYAYFIHNQITSYATHNFVGIAINIILIGLSLFFIKKYKLAKEIGLHKYAPNRIGLLVFPLLYLPLVNLVFKDATPTNNLILNIPILILYCLSIGFAEELSIRGFLQTFAIKYFGKTKKKVIIMVLLSSLFFGFLHLLKFNKGLYGELSQVLFATFIGFLFGILLLVTKRIYPLIIIHAIIDFCAKLDTVGIPVKASSTEATSIPSAILGVVITIPYFIYALILIKRNKLLKT